MELSDKTINNLVALSSACLRGEKVTYLPLEMAELWGDITTAATYLQRDKTPAGSVPSAGPNPI